MAQREGGNLAWAQGAGSAGKKSSPSPAMEVRTWSAQSHAEQLREESKVDGPSRPALSHFAGWGGLLGAPSVRDP